MNIENILTDLGITSYNSYKEIYGGKDSTVFKIEVTDEIAYALHILPREGYQQFIRENELIELAFNHDIPVPKVFSIKLVEGFAVMLMEWVSGNTILHAILESPENSRNLGIEFGKIQALINRIEVPNMIDNKANNWLFQENEEEYEVLNKIEHMNKSLLHLDYHPLNVLTDGEKITGVIDWANGSIGDNRFDFARTLSILQLEGIKIFESNPSLLNEFVSGWWDGYEEIYGKVEFTPLFTTWAGIRLKWDLAKSLTSEDHKRIDEWIEEVQSWIISGTR